MYITAKNLPDAWYQAVYNLIDWDDERGAPKNGVLWKIDQGSYEGTYRLEYPFVAIEVEFPISEPLLPDPPEGSGMPTIADMEYVNKYFMEYFMGDTVPKNTQYTYGSRINQTLYKNDDTDESIRQLDLLLDRLEEHPHSNQLILQIASPYDLTLLDPPCLRSIAFKVIGDRLDFHIYFRSNDLINGFPVNMACIALFLRYATVIYPQFYPGKFYYFSSGLHIYDHAFEYAAQRCYKPEFLEKVKEKMKI